MNLEIVGNLISITLIMVSGPLIVGLLALKKGNI
uniref:Photosystem II reaction center protein Psb30 n=2 Tax=Palmophyllaceae TaxID=2201466 RepID=A0A161KBV5_9VIRI|nr:hypothetical chloroplast RF12 [Verdigellas peltata]YP_009340860.1 hypothetical chloroplast RF12 [Palmophyllum crassum]BAW34807.1 hypothetical chloroplast RF12 [Palmophyllum crassum]CZF96681.1 hypothetical chloroplast RF12 [Verdigellas peltata]